MSCRESIVPMEQHVVFLVGCDERVSCQFSKNTAARIV